MKLWDKGYATNQKIDLFTVGNDRHYDSILAKYDLIASIAHAKMLANVGLIKPEEAQALVGRLEKFLAEAQNGLFAIEDTFEDMHSKIEHLLISELGETGKKIHMARSRNDQVLVAIHLYLKEVLEQTLQDTKSLFDLLIQLANQHKNTLLPGYTHLQIAMPSSFGLWFSAYAESLVDDVYFLKAAYMVADQNPLGSAAGYGSSFPIDRSQTTEILGFSTLKYNVIAAQMGRGKVERSAAIGMSAVAATLSKLSMDICLYMSQNFDFIRFPNELTTGSSIMPHKKNPDVFELIRGKCNKIQAIPNQLALLSTNLPSGYHRDMQLTKEIIMPAIEDLKACIEMATFSIRQIQVNPSILDDPKYDYLFSVENVNNEVSSGLPFREAYQKVGRAIADGSFKPHKQIHHTHAGSVGNLCLDDISEKMKKAMEL